MKLSANAAVTEGTTVQSGLENLFLLQRGVAFLAHPVRHNDWFLLSCASHSVKKSIFWKWRLKIWDGVLWMYTILFIFEKWWLVELEIAYIYHVCMPSWVVKSKWKAFCPMPLLNEFEFNACGFWSLVYLDVARLYLSLKKTSEPCIVQLYTLIVPWELCVFALQMRYVLYKGSDLLLLMWSY